MPLVGTRSLARVALNAKLSIRRNEGNPLSGNDEWEVLKAYGCRFVALHKATNTVYKVDGGDDMYSREGLDNRMELHNARVLRRRSDDGIVSAYVRIPRVSGFTINNNLVIAMEYVSGEVGARTSSVPRLARRELFNLGFNDMHGYNYVWDGCYIWPIDMGSARSQRNTTRNYEPDKRVLTYDEW